MNTTQMPEALHVKMTCNYGLLPDKEGAVRMMGAECIVIMVPGGFSRLYNNIVLGFVTLPFQLFLDMCYSAYKVYPSHPRRKNTHVYPS